MNPLLIRRRGMMQAGGGTPLPYDSKISAIYSASNNTSSYIELPYTPNIDTEIIIRAYLIIRNNNGYFGSRLDPLRFCATTFSNGSQVAFAMTDNNWPSTRLSYSVNHFYTFFAKNGQYGWEGNTYTSPTLNSFSTTEKFQLFRIRMLGSNYYYSAMGVSNITIKENGSVVQSYYSVRVGTTPYLYEEISGNMYGNMGGGTLYAGNDIQ